MLTLNYVCVCVCDEGTHLSVFDSVHLSLQVEVRSGRADGGCQAATEIVQFGL